MERLTAFERGQIVGALSTGASVAKTAELLNMSKDTVSKVMAAYSKNGQIILDTLAERKQQPSRKPPKPTPCGDTPLHALDRALSLEKQGDEDDDEELDDEDMIIRKVDEEEDNGSSEEQNESEEVQGERPVGVSSALLDRWKGGGSDNKRRNHLSTMKQLTEFERGLIVGARMAGASVTRTAELLNVSRGTVSKVLTAFAKYGQTASAKRNCGRKAKLSDSERRALIRIVAEKHRNQTARKTTTFDITTELNQNRCDPVSTRTVRRELGKVLEVLKHGMCGDIGNIPIHEAPALEKQEEEEEDEEEEDEDMNIQKACGDEVSSQEENELQEERKFKVMTDERFH
ncbi:hypothetical protein AOLI_G00068130 [Acnodon oligacanthus]